MVCQSFLVPQKSSHPKEALPLSRLAELVVELSNPLVRSVLLYQQLRSRSARRIRFVLLLFRKHRQRGKPFAEISAIGHPLLTPLENGRRRERPAPQIVVTPFRERLALVRVLFGFGIRVDPFPIGTGASAAPLGLPNMNGAPFIFKEAEAPSSTLIISKP